MSPIQSIKKIIMEYDKKTDLFISEIEEEVRRYRNEKSPNEDLANGYVKPIIIQIEDKPKKKPKGRK